MCLIVSLGRLVTFIGAQNNSFQLWPRPLSGSISISANLVSRAEDKNETGIVFLCLPLTVRLSSATGMRTQEEQMKLRDPPWSSLRSASAAASTPSAAPGSWAETRAGGFRWWWPPQQTTTEKTRQQESQVRSTFLFYDGPTKPQADRG